VACDVNTIISEGNKKGLHLNVAKCELITNSNQPFTAPLDQFQRINTDDAMLLGAPLSNGHALDLALDKKIKELNRASARLRRISAHDALVLLKASCGAPKLMHLLRAAPCVDHAALPEIDKILRSCLVHIANVDVSDAQWTQASLPVKAGGLGLRSPQQLALSAFLASVSSTKQLQDLLLARCQITSFDLHHESLLIKWTTTFQPASPPTGALTHKQQSWDKPSVDSSFLSLLDSQPDDYGRARLLAAADAHSGDWLNVVPVSSCGLRLDDEAIRVAVGLRLGANLCDPHVCPCGTYVDCRGSHGLSCRRSSGKMARHSYINDLIYHALVRAGIPSTKEPAGLSRTDGKRPDGLTLVPWTGGKSAIWDVTIVDTLASSYLPSTSMTAKSAAEIASSRKETKYAALVTNYNFIPIALESMGCVGSKASAFLRELGRRLTLATEDPLETTHLFQRLSVALQRFNAVCFRGTFTIPQSDVN
jgi:hypothetical protein